MSEQDEAAKVRKYASRDLVAELGESVALQQDEAAALARKLAGPCFFDKDGMVAPCCIGILGDPARCENCNLALKVFPICADALRAARVEAREEATREALGRAEQLEASLRAWEQSQSIGTYCGICKAETMSAHDAACPMVLVEARALIPPSPREEKK